MQATSGRTEAGSLPPLAGASTKHSVSVPGTRSWFTRSRPGALICAVALLVCELISRPWAETGIADDWTYIRIAQHLAQTGHIQFDGYTMALVGWQLYLGAAAIRLFGFSFTAPRMAVLLVALVCAALLQRVFMRCGLRERNATVATLIFVLSPVYMQMATTYMTDVTALFGLVLCLYGCLRALQTPNGRKAAAWIAFAALGNLVFGSSRQIAWLGVLVVVPSTLWLLRRNRTVVLWGGLATLLGWLGIAAILHWFHQQPYAIGDSGLIRLHNLRPLHSLVQLGKASLAIPFLAFPLAMAFLPRLRKAGWRFWAVAVAIAAAYMGVTHRQFQHGREPAVLQPILGDWLSPQGYYSATHVNGLRPVVLSFALRVVLTIVCGLGTASVCGVVIRAWRGQHGTDTPEATALPDEGQPPLSWWELSVLVGPFLLASAALFVPVAAQGALYDRYILAPIVVAILCATRIYQQFVRPQLGRGIVALTAATALFAIACTHDLYAEHRARLVLAQEAQAAGISPSELDGTGEMNGWYELHTGGYINDALLRNPPGAYHVVDPYRGYGCHADDRNDGRFPHVIPHYGMAYTPDACAGSAALPPATYREWLHFMRTAHLYVVKYTPRS